MSDPVIMTCAPTGGIHAPVVPDQPRNPPTAIAGSGNGAAGAGASIIHLRARDAANEWPDPAPALFGLLLPRNKPAHAPEVGGSTRGGPGHDAQ